MGILDEIAATRGHVSSLWKALAPDEVFLDAAFRLYRAAMHGEGGLGRVERELLCFATSLANRCAYCVAHHRRHLEAAGLPGTELAALEAGEPLGDARLEALRRLAEALASRADAPPGAFKDALRAQGFTDLEQQQAIQVCAAYGMFNRLALALEVPLEPGLAP
ncbi:MAG: peroxidase-related enzyme [Holophagaceae bacterium]